MPKFLYVYHGGGPMPQTEEEGRQAMKAWMDWFGELGSAVVDGGNPVGMSKTVLPGGQVRNDGGASPAAGYSVIEASDIDDAVEKAKGCPMLMADGNSVEVAPIIEMG